MSEDAPRPGRGRPRKPAGATWSKAISLRVSPGVYAALVDRQRAEGVGSLAQLVTALAILGYTRVPVGGLRDAWAHMLELLPEDDATLHGWPNLD